MQFLRTHNCHKLKQHISEQRTMVQFSSLFEGLAKSVSSKGRNTKNDEGSRATESLEDEARKNHLILRCPGVTTSRSNAAASVLSKKGEKGINQDCLTVLKMTEPLLELLFRVVYSLATLNQPEAPFRCSVEQASLNWSTGTVADFLSG